MFERAAKVELVEHLTRGPMDTFGASIPPGCAQTSFDPNLEAAAVQVLTGISAAQNYSSAAIGETSEDPRVKKEDEYAWLYSRTFIKL